MSNSIHINKQAEQTVIQINGSIDRETAFNLMGIPGKVEPPVVLDMQEVGYLSSAGCFAILSFYTDHEVKPTIRYANPRVISMLELAGVLRYIHLSADHETSQPFPQD